MPPYTPNASKAQQRLMFAKAGRGEISMADAKGRAQASDYAHLPAHVSHGARHHGNAMTRGLHRAVGRGRRA